MDARLLQYALARRRRRAGAGRPAHRARHRRDCGAHQMTPPTPGRGDEHGKQGKPLSEHHGAGGVGPGTLEMALPLVEAVKIRPGMRVLEVGAGSGQVAAILAAHWDVSVAALEPWEGGQEIPARAA